MPTPSPLAAEPPPDAAVDGRAAPVVERLFDALPPPLLVLLAMLCIQLGAGVAVQLFPHLGPTGTVFLRLVLSALLLLVLSRPRLDANARRHAGLVVVFGLLFAVMNLSFYQAIARVPLGVVVTIEFLGPLAVAVATSRRVIDFVWIGLALVGVALLAPAVGVSLDPVGLGFAAIAGVGWGAFILVGRRLGRVLPSIDGLTLALCVAAVLVLPLALAEGNLGNLDARLMLAGFLMALLATTLPFSLEFAALKRMPPRVYGVLVTLEPAIAMGVGLVLLGQSVSATSLLAMALVVTASVGMTRSAGGH